MSEVYVAHYRVNRVTRLVELVGTESLVSLDAVSVSEEYFLAGSGFRACHEAGFLAHTQSALDENIMPHAAALAELAQQAINQGQVFSADKIQINYIRNKVAQKKKESIV
jgi:tRNA A37 threonylcarbamoyladenosine modification protein TsaB